ncbi:hypothetical protein Alg130_11535, partial [Pyrenophora tritici-repentis]
MPTKAQKKRAYASTTTAKAPKRLGASQHVLSPSPPWESQFLESQHEAQISAPTEDGSHAGTASIAATEESCGADSATNKSIKYRLL